MKLYKSLLPSLLLFEKPKTVFSSPVESSDRRRLPTSVIKNVTQDPSATAPLINYVPLAFSDVSSRLILQETTNDQGKLECVLCSNASLPWKCVKTQPTQENSVPVMFLPYKNMRKIIRLGDLEFFLVGGPAEKINPMFGLLHHLGLKKYKVPKNMGAFPFVSTKNPNDSWLMGNFRKRNPWYFNECAGTAGIDFKLAFGWDKSYLIGKGNGKYKISEPLLDIEDAQFEKNYYPNSLVYMILLASFFAFICSLRIPYDILYGRNFLIDSGEAGQNNSTSATTQNVDPNEEEL